MKYSNAFTNQSIGALVATQFKMSIVARRIKAVAGWLETRLILGHGANSICKRNMAKFEQITF